MELMTILEQKRHSEQLTYREFAEHLGVDMTLYFRAAKNPKRVGEKLRAAVVKTYPELADLVIKSYEAVA